MKNKYFYLGHNELAHSAYGENNMDWAHFTIRKWRGDTSPQDQWVLQRTSHQPDTEE